jgi:hypothetical protein
MSHREAPSCNGSQQESQKLTGDAAGETTTPRTDAFSNVIAAQGTAKPAWYEFARQLERESSELKAQLEGFRKDAERFRPIFDEMGRAVVKFPTWPTDPLHAIAVLGEEYGELVKDVLQFTYEPHKTSLSAIRQESIQTAAMALRFWLSIDTYRFAQGEQHKQVAAIDSAQEKAS